MFLFIFIQNLLEEHLILTILYWACALQKWAKCLIENLIFSQVSKRFLHWKARWMFLSEEGILLTAVHHFSKSTQFSGDVDIICTELGHYTLAINLSIIISFQIMKNLKVMLLETFCLATQHLLLVNICQMLKLRSACQFLCNNFLKKFLNISFIQSDKYYI